MNVNIGKIENAFGEILKIFEEKTDIVFTNRTSRFGTVEFVFKNEKI